MREGAAVIRLLVRSSVRSRGLVAVLGLAVLVFGAVQVINMPKDALPEFGPPSVEVQTEALGLSAQEVEQLITTPLEQDLLNGVAFVDTIRSESLPGLSRIEMVFEDGTDIARARQVVNERLTQAHGLPNVSKPPQMLQPRSSMSRIMMVRVSSDDQSLLELGLLARWTIRPKIMGVSGVANVSIWGHQEQQLQVQVDPQRLQEEGVTLEQVISSAGNALWVSNLTFLEASTPGAGGFYDTATQRIGVEHTQPIQSPEDLAKTVIEPGPNSAADAPVQRLGDVTTIVEDHQPLIGNAAFSDGEGLLIVVEKLPEANVVEVSDAVQSALDSLVPGLRGIELDTTLFRPADYVEDSLSSVRLALIMGFALLVMALVAFLFRLRLTLVSVVSVLVSMSAAVAVLAIRGETLNLMTLAGLVLALAVLVDDAVNSAFCVIRARDEGGTERESITARLAVAVDGVRRPLLYGTVILLLPLIPLFVLTGETGAFFPSLALSYLGAVVVSTIVALTFTPALAMLLGGGTGARRSPVLAWIQRRYHRLVDPLVGTARPGLLVGGVLLVVGAVAFPFLDRDDSMVPTLRDRDLLVHWDGAPGTALPEMSRIAGRASRELRELPGVENVGGHVGRAVLGDQSVNVNSSEIWVRLDEDADYASTLDAVERVVNGYPGIESSVLTYGRDRIDDVLGDPDGVEGADVTVRTFGYTLDEIKTQATRVREAVAGIDGVDSTTIELPVMEPTLEVVVDLDRAQEFGVKPGDVRRAAATVLSGIEVGNLFEDQKVFEVVVRGTPETSRSLSDVGEVLVDRPGGGDPVALAEVAEVRIVPSPNVIRHVGVSRSMDVGVDVGGRDVDDVAEDIEAAIQGLQFPIEYHAEVLGDYADRQSDRLVFLGVAGAALLGIFLILQAGFGSWLLAVLVFVALPGALTGGVLAALVDRDPLSIGTLAGFLVLYGLAARNSITFVQRCHQLEDGNGALAAREHVGLAARERLAPTLTGAVTAFVALLPLLFFGGSAGHEVIHPMAVVVLGGLVTVTAFSLFVVPSLYGRFGNRSEASRERFELYSAQAVDDDLEAQTVPSSLSTAET